MLCPQIHSCAARILPQGAVPQQVRIQSTAEMVSFLDALNASMAVLGHGEKDQFHVRLALEEAIVNAHKHGHQGDWSRPIIVHYHVGNTGVVAEIEDQGDGFDPSEVPDPRLPENLERSTGRGLFLMNTTMSGVCHNEKGNRVCLCKHHQEAH